jgi:hypothetical protein
MTTTALEVSQPRTIGLVRPVASPAAVIEAHREAAALIKDALEQGRDYGTIPGAGVKMVLLKPGAERLTLAFGASVQLDIIEKEIDHDREVQWSKYSKSGTSRGLYRYVVRVRLVRPDGSQIGEGIGAASTMESKYIEAPRNAENTVLKMAKKRAHVDAVLSMAALSDRFTQDIDDADDEGARRDDTAKRSADKAKAEADKAKAEAEKAEADKAAKKAAQEATLAAIEDLAEDIVTATDSERLASLHDRIGDVAAKTGPKNEASVKARLISLSEKVAAKFADATWMPADNDVREGVLKLERRVEERQVKRKQDAEAAAAQAA